MDDIQELISDIRRMLGRMGMDAATIEKRINDALMGVLAEGIGAKSTRFEQARQTVLAALKAPAPEVLMMPASTVAASGRYWKGTGRYAQDEDGKPVEIGTWMNPAGEIEAQRLTRETGVQHFVNPKTGEVEAVGGAAVEKMAQAAPVVVSQYVPVIAPVGEAVKPA